MEHLTFEETTEKIIEFLDIVSEKGEIEYILENMIIPEFRGYYTPNIPYDSKRKYNEGEKKIFIKNKIIELEEDPSARRNIICGKTYEYNGEGNIRYTGIMSFREIMYVYANPEGFKILEKILFMIEETDWSKFFREKFSDIDTDDDIPF